MLTSLLDGTSDVIHSSPFPRCSMKSIGAVSLCFKAALCQRAPQAASYLIDEKLKNSLCVSFPYETTHGRNIPLKPTRIEIWENNPPNQNTWLVLLPHQSSSLTSFSLLCSSETYKRFLHACTPARLTRAYAHLFNQCTYGHTSDTTKHILQKNLQGAETLGNVPSGGASKPHRSKYMRLHYCFAFLLF